MLARDVILNKWQTKTILNPFSVTNFASRFWTRDLVTPGPLITNNRKGWNPWNYHTRVRQNHVGSMALSEGTFGGAYKGNVIATYDGPIIDTTGIYFDQPDETSYCFNVAMQQLIEQTRGGLDISVAVGESHQTKRMLNSVKKFERYFSGIGPRRWASEWLELTYGWKPLLSDIYDSADELLRFNKGRTVIDCKGFTKYFYASGKRAFPAATDWTGVGQYTANTVYAEYSAMQNTRVRLKLQLAAPTSIQEASRWTSLNPLSIAWELTPYSFVADWFVDIGGYLRGVETALLYHTLFEKGYVSYSRFRHTDEEIKYVAGPDYFDRITRISTSSHITDRQFDRIMLVDYPLPRLPGIKTDLSWRRLVSAGALLVQNFEKLFPSLRRAKKKLSYRDKVIKDTREAAKLPGDYTTPHRY